MVGSDIRVAGSAILAAICGGTAGGQSPVVAFNGSTSASFVCAAGQPVALTLAGPAGAHFALLASPGPLTAATPYGVLCADPFHPAAALVYDGYDPLHPTFAWSEFSLGGTFVQNVVPFAYGGGYFASYRIQAVAADPTSPFGHSLSGHTELIFMPPVPEVLGTTPSLAVPGDAVQIAGLNFLADPSAMSVTVGGKTCQVVGSSATVATVILPPDAVSGPILVTHAGGTSGYNDAMGAWLAVSPPAPLLPLLPGGVVPTTLGAGLTHSGTLLQSQTQDFLVHLEPGQKVRAEMYPWDQSLGAIGFPIPGPGSPYADPMLTLLKNPAAPWKLYIDDNDGPGACAAIGATSEGAWYVAEEAEDVIIRASFRNHLAAGEFVVVIAVESAPEPPLSLTAVHPEIASPGDVVTVYGTGFSPGSEGFAVVLGPLTIEPFAMTPTRMSFVVPALARSGPLGLLGPGAIVTPTFEDVETWLVVAPSAATLEIEGDLPTLALPATYVGTLFAGYDQDDVLVALEAGQKLSVEAYGGDIASGDIENSPTYYSPILDPEIRIMHPTQAWPLYVWEWNAGPGVNAMIGNGGSTPVFTATASGLYRVKFSSAYWGSWGQYLAVLTLQP